MNKENSKFDKNEKKTKVSKSMKYLNYFTKTLAIVLGGFLAILITCVYRADILPGKYLILFTLFCAVIMAIFGFLLWRKNDFIFKIIVSLLSILICIVSAFGITYLTSTYDFLHNLTIGEYEYVKYNVVVTKGKYDDISELKGLKVSMMDENSSNVIEELNKKVDVNTSTYSEIGPLLDSLYNSEVESIVVDEDVYGILKDDDSNVDFESNTEVIYTFEVKTKVSEEEVEEVSLTKDPFILYISGIDQFGEVSTVRGRSDVNMLVVVNPNTKKVLLVNTPRDYYVNLRGKTGMKDKLTHAGVYGIDTSIGTLEDLYNTNINYYMRVNFNTLTTVVDVIGGVDIFSDAAFTCYTNSNVTVTEGWNHFDGTQALAFSRERHAYLLGDRHRGQNQQDVITAIIKKTTSSKVLLTKYNSILDTLDGTFQTNMPTNTITNFIKYQLNVMPEWDISSISVSGSDASEYTYSYGTKQKLYVMVPYENEVNEAKTKIAEILNGN